MIRDSVVPRMIGTLAAAAASPAAGRAARRGLRRARCVGGAASRLRSSASGDRDSESRSGRGVFEHLHGAARRRLMALPLELEIPIVVADDPVIRDGARSSRRKTASNYTPRGTATWKSSVEAGGARSGVVVGPVLPLEKRIRGGERRRCPGAAASSPTDPDACRDCARSGPWLAASSPG